MNVVAYNRLPQAARPIIAAASVLVVLTLALLNPLMCLIHCALVVDQQAHAARGAHNGFLCHLDEQHGDATMAATSTTDSSRASDHTTPQAFYKSLGPVSGALLLALVVLLLLHDLTLRLPRLIFRPPAPPPRLLLCA